MELYSTNRRSKNVSFKEALFRALPPDNGLYMPVHIPQMPASFFAALPTMSLSRIAFEVSKALLGDEIPPSRLETLVADAFNFQAPVLEVAENIYALELFHGPTAAFKDFGARFMSRLMGYFLAQEAQEIHILVATSGDTGSAVAKGFLGIPQIKVTILYPQGKVSEIQEKQLTTLGQNIRAIELQGTFDDCQRLVKQAFLDEEISKSRRLTSANSINIARLIPQSFYYFHAFARLPKHEKPLVFSVPSGNFGNLCGGLIALKMGLPVSYFIAATNQNHVVPDYLLSGKFEAKPSVKTLANAMDVGNPSNFPRLRALLGGNWEGVTQKIRGCWYSDAEIEQIIAEVYQTHKYTLCPHTAIGYQALKDTFSAQNKPAKGVFLATAHPAKFADVVKRNTRQELQIPAVLQSAIEKEKQSVLMPNDFEALKSYILN